MNDILLSPIRLNELETLIQNSVRKVLAESPKAKSHPEVLEPEYTPVQELFKKKYCSAPTFYDHVKRGNVTLYKFGGKSFVKTEEFFQQFHKVKTVPSVQRSITKPKN